MPASVQTPSMTSTELTDGWCSLLVCWMVVKRSSLSSVKVVKECQVFDATEFNRHLLFFYDVRIGKTGKVWIVDSVSKY